MEKFTNKIIPWYKQEEVVIGHLDIESSNLKANAGQILSWAIKIDGKDEIRSSLITTKEIQDYKTFDKRVCQEWIDAIRGYGDPSCNIDRGFEEAMTFNLANLAYVNKKPVTWDKVNEKAVIG